MFQLSLSTVAMPTAVPAKGTPQGHTADFPAALAGLLAPTALAAPAPIAALRVRQKAADDGKGLPVGPADSALAADRDAGLAWLDGTGTVPVESTRANASTKTPDTQPKETAADPEGTAPSHTSPVAAARELCDTNRAVADQAVAMTGTTTGTNTRMLSEGNLAAPAQSRTHQRHRDKREEDGSDASPLTSLSTAVPSIVPASMIATAALQVHGTLTNIAQVQQPTTTDGSAHAPPGASALLPGATASGTLMAAAGAPGDAPASAKLRGGAIAQDADSSAATARAAPPTKAGLAAAATAVENERNTPGRGAPSISPVVTAARVEVPTRPLADTGQRQPATTLMPTAPSNRPVAIATRVAAPPQPVADDRQVQPAMPPKPPVVQQQALLAAQQTGDRGAPALQAPSRLGAPAARGATTPLTGPAPLSATAAIGTLPTPTPTIAQPATPPPLSAHADRLTHPAPVVSPIDPAAPVSATAGTVPTLPNAATVTAASATHTAPAALSQTAAMVFGVSLAGIKAAQRTSDDRLSARDQALQALSTLASIGQTVPAAAGQTPQASIDMQRNDWPQAMIDHIDLLRDAANASSTRLTLVPNALGKIDLSVRHDGNQVHVHFAADSAATRTLLADAQPRLAELAEARGIRLGQATINAGTGGSAQHQQQQQQQSQPTLPIPAHPASARAAHTAEATADSTRLA